MKFEKISDTEDIVSFDFTCPFCSKKYTVKKIWKYGKSVKEIFYTCDYNGATCGLDYHNYDILDYCKHLILWENCDSGLEYPEVINDLEWFTRMSVFPFRIWDVLCEVINNDQLPEGCEVKFRTFYVMDYIVFVFGNDPKTLVDVVLERTKEYIRQYHAQYPLKGKDFDRFSDILAHPSRIRFLRVLLTPQRAF